VSERSRDSSRRATFRESGPRSALALGARGLLVVALVAAALLVPSTRLLAQDDWEITREPERPRRPRARPARPARAPASSRDALLERYVQLVLARPDDEAAVRRLLERASARPGGVELLLGELEARRAEVGGPALDTALAALALGRGDVATARARLEQAIGNDAGPASAYLLYARIVLRPGGTGPTDSPPAVLAVRMLEEAVRRAPDPRIREGYQRELAEQLLAQRRVEEAREIYAQLARGGSPFARYELLRALAARGMCLEARSAYAEAIRAVASDASASVGVALLRAQCERELGDRQAAHDALLGAWSRAISVGRDTEVLDALLALAREADGLAALEAELSGMGTRAQLHRGIVLEELGRETDALEVFRGVLARQPRDAETRQRVARLLARNGRIEESLDEQRTLARLFPERIALTLELASALRSQGHDAESLAVLDRARARARRDRTALFLLVDAYARLGAEDRVLATLEAIVRADPDDPRALVALANELFDRGERERALALVERVARSERAGPLGEIEAARALANLRVFDRAIAHLEAAARAMPEAPEVLDAQADLYARMGRDDEAERALERRIALARQSPGDPVADQALADAESRLVASWARRGQLPRVRPELEARHAQGDASASRMLADLQRRSGDLAGALATLTQLAALSPSDARLQSTLARLHHERGDYDAEIAALRRLAELEPARAGWHYTRMVELALAAYRDEDAIAYADEAARRSIDDAGLFLRLGRLHSRRRDPERAAQAYARALAVDPDEFEAAWELASIERETGHGRRASELYLAILERSRDDELRERSGRAVLETARAEGAEAALEPRLLALALAHGDAPVFRRLALTLYASLTGASRARGDAVELERWVSRALPILLASLRDSDVGSRASARQLLFAHPVAGAAPALLALAADDTVEPSARVDALAAALRVVTPREEAGLLRLLESPSESLAVLALHGVMRVLGAPPAGARRDASAAGARAAIDRARVLSSLRDADGRLADHAWAWTLLLGGPGVPSEPPSSPRAPWLAAWHAAPSSAGAAVLSVLARQRVLGGHDDAAWAMAVELAASGPLGDPALDMLAVRALSAPDTAARAARRTLMSMPALSATCAPVLGRGESLEAWLGRVLEACPRIPRSIEPSRGALERAARLLPEAAVVRGLVMTVGDATLIEWAPVLEPTVLALASRLMPVRAVSGEGALALVRAASVVPGVLDAAAWSELLGSSEIRVRAASAASAPMPALSERLLEAVAVDPAWTVRRAALGALRSEAVSPNVRRRAAEAGLNDPVSFVRSAALELAASLPDPELCALLSARAVDRDPVVSNRTRDLLGRCPSR